MKMAFKKKFALIIGVFLLLVFWLLAFSFIKNTNFDGNKKEEKTLETEKNEEKENSFTDDNVVISQPEDNNSSNNDNVSNNNDNKSVEVREESNNSNTTIKNTNKDNKTTSKNSDKANDNTNINSNTSNSSSNNNSSNNNSTDNNSNSSNVKPIVPQKTLRERILSAYSKAGGSLYNFKNQLKKEFGVEGTGFKLIDNGNIWMVEILSDKYIEVINSNGNIESYLVPERDCGAVGNGINDDTVAINNCLNSSVKNIILKGTYLITGNIDTSREKNLFGGNFLLQIQNGNRALTFRNIVRMNGTSMSSTIKRTGTSPHGETFTSTSNIDFVEVWGREGRFINCKFNNALRAIRGRISTGSLSYPEVLYVNNSEFIASKAPIQGYFVNTTVENSYFKNNGDLYSGDHDIYLEAASVNSLTIKNSRVETYNTESGAAFQTYGKKNGQKIPKINIINTIINANGIVSADLADVTIDNASFVSQHTNRNAIIVENGSVLLEGSKINHNLLMARYPNTFVIAKNTEFKLNSTSGRAIFPTESINCTFINWGGYVVYPSTKVTNSIFTRDTDHVIGKYYIGVGEGSSIYVEGSAFKAGDNISYNSSGLLSIKNSYFVNNIGINVVNVLLEGNINKDIT